MNNRQPTTGNFFHALLIADYVKGVCTEVVGIEDVAEAFLLAGERGRVGERYIISESFMPMREMRKPSLKP